VLSDRQTKLLIDLCTKSENYLTASFLARKYAISVRTIQTEINEIKQVVDKLDYLEFISIPSKGSKIKILDDIKYSKLLDSLNDPQHFQNLGSKKERINKIIALLFETKKFMSVQHMADRLFISKSTFINDLKTAKSILKKYNIEIINKPQSGLTILADEVDIRTCIINENIDLFYAYNELMTIGQISVNISKIGDILVGLLTENKYRISDIALQNLIVHLDIIIRRIKIGFILESIYDEKLEQDFSTEILLSRKIFEECSRIFGVPIINSEVNRLAVYLRGKSDYPENSYITQDIDQFVHDSLGAIKLNFGIDLSENVQLRIALSLHLVPLITRLKYNMQLKNELLHSYRKSFQLAFDIASFFAYQIQEKFGYKLIEDEIAYFAIYFNTSLITYQKNSGTNKMLIISSLKRSETLLLRERINSWFIGAISELKIIGLYDLESISLLDYNVICTTERNVYYSKGVALLISQFPTEEDYRSIKMAMDGFSGKEDILAFFKQSMMFIGTINSKDELITRLSDLIEKQDSRNKNLKDEVFKREAMGGTFFGNFVAMPHPMRPITNKTYIAFALLENELIWDDNGNFARIVLLISIEENNPRAFQLWSYLSEFITNEMFVNAILDKLTFDNFMQQLSNALDNMNWELRDY